jgi:hypothetical protein
MARTWLTIRVELLSGIYAECDPAPGRVFLVGPRHTFQQLARAINVGFSRWDFSHLYDFELADGNVVGFPDEDSPTAAMIRRSASPRSRSRSCTTRSCASSRSTAASQ